MNSLVDVRFAEVIKAIPVDLHTVIVPPKKLLLSYDPKQTTELPISRKEIFEEKDEVKKLKKILLWGYPRVIYKWVPALLNDDKSLKFLGEELLKWEKTKNPKTENISSETLFSLTKGDKKVSNLGRVTLSKMAYFFRVDVEGNQALILDKRIIQCAGRWAQLSSLGLSGIDFEPKQYSEYLKKMYETADLIKCKADQIEFFLFVFGDSFG